MFTQEFTIKSYDVDHNDNVRISSLMKYFQQIARENLDFFGMTYSFLRQHNIVFVLTKYTIKLHGNIHSDDKVILNTAPCEIRGVTFIRDFTVTAPDGSLLVEASSAWVIIDFEKRSILRPNRLPMEIPTCDRLVDFIPDRTNVLEDFEFTYCSKVPYSRLDANNHLNNCNYVDLIMDGLYEHLDNVPEIKEITMQFDHEAVLRDELSLNYSINDNVIGVKCDNTTSGNVCFCAEISCK